MKIRTNIKAGQNQPKKAESLSAQQPVPTQM